MDKISDRLIELRTALGATQEEVAEACNISRVTLARYENGKRTPVAGNVSKLAAFYGVSVDYILGRESSTITVQGAKGNQQPQDLATFQIPADAPKIKPFHDLPQEEYTVISDDFEPTHGPATRAIINSILAKLAQLDEEGQKETDTFIDFILAKRNGGE